MRKVKLFLLVAVVILLIITITSTAMAKGLVTEDEVEEKEPSFYTIQISAYNEETGAGSVETVIIPVK